MLGPFRLRRPIGPDSNMDLDDVLNTKRALRDLGHYRIPKYGLTPYPDEPMIAGIKSFQRRHGLREDGVMKPDGSTLERLSRVLADRNRVDERPPRSLVGIHHTIRRDDDPPAIPWRGPASHRPDLIPTLLENLGRSKDRRTSVFGIGSDLGIGRANRPADILAVKRALAWSGHYPRNKALDIDGRVDEGLFTAVRRFQQAAGVKVDGWLRPGGETEKALDATIAPRVQAFKSESAGEAPTGSKGDTDSPQIAMARKPRPGEGTGATEGAGTFPLVGGTAAAIGTAIGAQEIVRQQQQKKGVGEVSPAPEPGTANPRTDIAPPLPPTPGLEPPEDEDRPPTKTESPAIPVKILDLTQPIPDTKTPTIFISPAPKPGEFGPLILQSKGGPRAKKQLDEIRDEYLDAHEGWEQVGGGRNREDGSEKTEFYTAGPGRAFPRPGKKEGEGDGRAGSARLDLSFRAPDGKTYVHIQTVDVDKNGNVTEREWDNTLRAWKNLNERRQEGEIHHIRLIAKDWMMKK